MNDKFDKTFCNCFFFSLLELNRLPICSIYVLSEKSVLHVGCAKHINWLIVNGDSIPFSKKKRTNYQFFNIFNFSRLACINLKTSHTALKPVLARLNFQTN